MGCRARRVWNLVFISLVKGQSCAWTCSQSHLSVQGAPPLALCPMVGAGQVQGHHRVGMSCGYPTVCTRSKKRFSPMRLDGTLQHGVNMGDSDRSLAGDRLHTQCCQRQNHLSVTRGNAQVCVCAVRPGTTCSKQLTLNLYRPGKVVTIGQYIGCDVCSKKGCVRLCTHKLVRFMHLIVIMVAFICLDRVLLSAWQNVVTAICTASPQYHG